MTSTRIRPGRPSREAIWAGDRELRRTAIRFGEDFRALRERAGVTQTAVARAIDVDPSQISRLERGDPGVGSRIRARASIVLGADFRLGLYHERAPLIHDAAHARIIERLLATTHPSWRRTLEAPVPGSGRRSVDVHLERDRDRVLMEVESRVNRLEEIVRELHGKREAFGLVSEQRRVHVVLVLPPTAHHRSLVRAHPEIVGTAFPVPSSALRDALERGTTWPGDGILWTAAG